MDDKNKLALNEKKNIVFDVDGVFADMDGSYDEYIKHIIPDYSEEKYITDWGMPIVAKNYPEAFEIVKSLWVSADFIGKLKRFPKVVEGLKDLENSIGKLANFIVHTHIYEEGEVFNSREKWLEDLREDSGMDFQIDISTGPNKSVKENTFILVEDCVANLQRSDAKYKILIRRCHNRNYSEKDLGKCKKSYVLPSFYDSVAVIKEIMNDERS